MKGRQQAATKSKAPPRPAKAVVKVKSKPVEAKSVSKNPPSDRTASVKTASTQARPASAKGAAAPARGSKAAPAKVAVAVPAKRSAPVVPSKLRKEKLAPEPMLVPPPAFLTIPENGKPRKNQAGLSSREMDHFREMLLAKRRELIGDMRSMELEALRSSNSSNLSNLPMHMADMGTDNYEQEFTLGLVQKDRDLLKEINTALAKLQVGTYGLCEGTGLPISKERLEFQPWARFSLDYQRKLERHGR